MAYQVRHALFEGPLDLLLYLVSKQKLDITEVSLADVAEEYWAYIKLLQDLDLDVESAYLVVFACLIEIKSRLLLPPEPEPEDYENFDLGDTAEHDLVERLKEYKRYKEASLALQDREREAIQVFPRPPMELGESAGLDGALDVSLPDLLEALRGLLEAHQKKNRKPKRLRVERVAVSVPQRMNEIMARLQVGTVMSFYELFVAPDHGEELTRAAIIVTFLALLELTRLRKIRIWQDERQGPIQLERTDGGSVDESLVSPQA